MVLPVQNEVGSRRSVDHRLSTVVATSSLASQIHRPVPRRCELDSVRGLDCMCIQSGKTNRCEKIGQECNYYPKENHPPPPFSQQTHLLLQHRCIYLSHDVF